MANHQLTQHSQCVIGLQFLPLSHVVSSAITSTIAEPISDSKLNSPLLVAFKKPSHYLNYFAFNEKSISKTSEGSTLLIQYDSEPHIHSLSDIVHPLLCCIFNVHTKSLRSTRLPHISADATSNIRTILFITS
jgi:hypothetical protein